MSTAEHVPETVGVEDALDAEDAWRTVRSVGPTRLAKDAFGRLRSADGFSHSRALAFQIVLALLPGVIVAVGLAVVLHSSAIADAIRRTIDSMAPGPAGDLFRTAFEQGGDAGERSGRNALLAGGVALLVSATTAFGQMERAANRIYGVERDRPPLRKYGRALVLALTAGVLLALSFIAIAIGNDTAAGLEDNWLGDVWPVVRWPLGIAVLAAATALVFKASPRRQQPEFSWLAVGATISVVLSFVVSIALHVYLNASESFGETYGPLAGIIGVMLWAYLGSIATLLGLAVAAQMEFERSRRRVPKGPAARAVRLDAEPAPENDGARPPRVAGRISSARTVR